MPRLWGFWTRGKLQILERYLQAFCTATKSVSDRVYLDLFAGEPENVDRLTGDPIRGSAEIAITAGPPQFTHIHLFEIGANASRLQKSLDSKYPGRGVVVHEGDSNETIGSVLADLRSVRWAPTFAFIDPNGPTCRWSTLEQLAAHRKGEKTKVELWLLLPVGLFIRNLPVDEDRDVRDEDAASITAMYGTDAWRATYEARRAGQLTPADARAEYVDLMRWRLETDFGYRWTHPFEVVNERGVSLYYMIFATDNPAGDRIMTHLYGKALEEFPAMARHAKELRKEMQDEQRGILSLFPAAELASLTAPLRGGRGLYRYEPPSKPRGTS